MVGGESRLLRRVVVIKVLAAEEPAARAAIALWSRVEVVQVSRDFWNAEAAVLTLCRQFVEAANDPRLLIVSDDGRSGKQRHIARARAALVESPDCLCRDVGVRGHAEVGIGPDPLHEVLLRRILGEVLEAIRPGEQ